MVFSFYVFNTVPGILLGGKGVVDCNPCALTRESKRRKQQQKKRLNEKGKMD